MFATKGQQPAQGEDPTSLRDKLAMVKKVDIKHTVIKVLACLILFIGMLMACVEEMENTPLRKRPPARGGKGEFTVPLFYFLIDSYVASYICMTIVVILLEIGNIFICGMGGINKTGDFIWQGTNAFVAFCIGCMWFCVIHYWNFFQYPVYCPLIKEGSNDRLCRSFYYSTYFDLYVLNWFSLIFAFYSAILFLVAAFFNMLPEDPPAPPAARTPQRPVPPPRPPSSSDE